MKIPPVAQRLGWAFYLAASWTWCIGMFLPVILHKDFHNGAWLIFWLCNVMGATAFGFVMTSAERSRAFVKANARACTVFSLVTMSFQAFFIGWAITRMPGWLAVGPLAALLALWLGGSRDNAGLQTSAAAVWVLSIAAFAVYLMASPEAQIVDTLFNEFQHFSTQSLYALPILLFGFLLSPYLDLTFHQVPEASADRKARLSFAIGFPLLFGVMLVFALAYRDEVAALLLGSPTDTLANYLKGVLAFLILQAGFTLIVHSRRLQALSLAPSAWLLATTTPLLIAPLMGDVMLPWGMSVNETLYRCFMAFYGIVAPAYVWLAAFNPKPVRLIAGLVTVAVALALMSIPMLLQSAHHLYLYALAVALVVLLRFIKRAS
ncbi:MAG TPA: hypothetical protein VIM96_06635 [Pseudomonadales bacterium]